METKIRFKHPAGGGTAGSLVQGTVSNGLFIGRWVIGGGSHISGDTTSKGTESIEWSTLAKKMRAQTANWEIFGESSKDLAKKNKIQGEFIPWDF